MAARASITPAVSAAVSPTGATTAAKGSNPPAASASAPTTPAATTPAAKGAPQNASNDQGATASQTEATASGAARAGSSPGPSAAAAATASFAWAMAQADTAAVAPDASASTSGDGRDVGAAKPHARDAAEVDAPTADLSSGALAALSLLLGDAMRGITTPTDGETSNSAAEDTTDASLSVAAGTLSAPAASATPATGATLPTSAGGTASAAMDGSNSSPSNTQSTPLQPAMGAGSAATAAIKLAASATAVAALKTGASAEAAGDDAPTTAASSALATPPSATTSPTQLVRLVPVPVSDRAWPQAVATQVHWLASNGVQSATLKLSPEHLGPVEIHIELQSSQVNVTFSAAHAETRGALEQTVPRLRELLASNGLTLGHTQVQQEARPGRPPPDRRSSPGVESDEPVSLPISGTLGLIDEYA
jgi:flagellar hook-length control protein FliK